MLLEVSVEALDSGMSSRPPFLPALYELTCVYLAGIDRNAIKQTETGVWIGSFVKGMLLITSNSTVQYL